MKTIKLCTYKKATVFVLSMLLCVLTVIPAFANETSKTKIGISSVTIAETEVQPDVSSVVTSNEDVIQPRGSLSGYGHRWIGSTTGSPNGVTDGSYTFTVNGSWSPWAGLTVKAEGFSSDAIIVVHVLKDGNFVCDGIDLYGSNQEKANIALWNVSPGEYTVNYSVKSSVAGTIHTWIY